MNEKYTQDYICELLKKAKEADPKCKVFGSAEHKYRLNPPASAEEVSALEADLNLKLPEDYVYFLTEIGNGGAGPYYGLYSVKELRRQQFYTHQDGKGKPVIDRDLSVEKWNALMEQMDTNDDDVYDEIDRQINAGVLIIGTQGCTYDNLLMCEGSETGNIVYIDWNLDKDAPPVLTQMSFWEWYLGFFEDIAAGYNVDAYGYRKRADEEELIAEYQKSAEVREKRRNLDGLMRFDQLSPRTAEFLYYVKDREADDARLTVLLKYRPDLGMKLFDRLIHGENIPAAVSVIRRIPKEMQRDYYRRAIEILNGTQDCDKRRLLFFIGDQKCKKASDIIKFAEDTNVDNELRSTAIYVLGTCADAMDFEESFIAWMKGDDYRMAHTALQAAISSGRRSHVLMETFRWMEERYKTDSVIQNNLKRVL